MKNINNIIEKANYISTSHGLTHPRTDGRDLWFSYKDAYFKVCYNSNMKMYELYDVVDKIKKERLLSEYNA